MVGAPEKAFRTVRGLMADGGTRTGTIHGFYCK